MLRALCQWLGDGLRVHVLSHPTRVSGVSFPRGSLLLRVAENRDGLHDAVAASVKTHGLTVQAVDSAFVEEGAGLGGPNIHWTKPPRVLLMVDRPASYALGHAWYLFDQVWRKSSTVRRADHHLLDRPARPASRLLRMGGSELPPCPNL